MWYDTLSHDMGIIKQAFCPTAGFAQQQVNLSVLSTFKVGQATL